MSVLIPDLRIYNYIQAGVEKMAFNNTADDFFSSTIHRHFHGCVDVGKEAKRLILSWLDLNQRSYNKQYKDDQDNINLCGMYSPDYTHAPLTAIQTLKYLQCISYNIEIEPEEFKNDLQLLRSCIEDLQSSIIGATDEYKRAKWSE